MPTGNANIRLQLKKLHGHQDSPEPNPNSTSNNTVGQIANRKTFAVEVKLVYATATPDVHTNV